MNFRVLEGDHGEQAVLVVTTDVDTLNEDTLLPTVAPNHEGTSVFVYHPQVVAFMQQMVATALVASEVIDDLDNTLLPELQHYIQQLEGENLIETLGRLAQGLPHFKVLISRTRLQSLSD